VSRDSSPDALSLMGGGDRDVKLAFVRKLILAIQKSDEHGALDALDSLIEECTAPSASDDEE
jgi:hypothetical protein